MLTIVVGSTQVGRVYDHHVTDVAKIFSDREEKDHEVIFRSSN